MRYSCGHVSTKKNVRGIKDAAASTPPQLRSSRYIRYRDNIGYPRYGERYDIGDNQYSSNNLSYCPINRFLESVPTLSVDMSIPVKRSCAARRTDPSARAASRLPFLCSQTVVPAVIDYRARRDMLAGTHARSPSPCLWYTMVTVST